MADEQARPARSPVDDYLVIGWVVAPHGVRGEVKVDIRIEDASALMGQAVYLGDQYRRLEVASVRMHQDRALLRFAGIEDRNSAERLRGQAVSLRRCSVEPLEEGVYYYDEIEGLTVVDEAGSELGVLHEVLPTGANDVYVVRGPVGELLLPAIRDVILSIDPEHGRMVVRVPPGLEAEQ